MSSSPITADYSLIRERLSPDQVRVFDRILNQIGGSSSDPVSFCLFSSPPPPLFTTLQVRLFVSGTAGTGKSFLITALIDAVGAKNVFVCAPTGVAAKQVKGKTIHALFNLPVAKNGEQDDGRLFTAPAVGDNLKLVIVDEISMCSAEMFDRVESAMRAFRPNCGVFGGFSLVLFGDLLQIPPVNARWIFECKWGGVVLLILIFPLNVGVFSAQWWPCFEYEELEVNHRQHTDMEFAEMLQRWRLGRVSGGDMDFLQSRQVSGTPSYAAVAEQYCQNGRGSSMILVQYNKTADELNSRVSGGGGGWWGLTLFYDLISYC